ncbi:MAG TPA: hypothetical protein VHZ55_17645 [Bryobacteraceae bacterium]|nr:hypothetical protein [Bryobacteraceae bacterium]
MKRIFCTLLALTAIYCALIYLPFQRHLWFDELLTYYIARAPNLELARKWDLTPPLMHVLAHVCLAWSNGNPIAVRIPSVVAFYIGSLALFGYAARKLGYWFGIVLVLVLWYSPTFPYATEARPYALLYCFFCCLLFCWDLAATNQIRKTALAGVALFSFGLVNAHVLAPLSILPFVAAELVRWKRSHKADVALWAALLLPLGFVFSYFPLIRSYQTIGHYPLAFQASLHALASYYWHTFTGVVLCLATAWAAAKLAQIIDTRRRAQAYPRGSAEPADAVLMLVVSLVPVVLDVIMMRDHAPFWGRYCITSAVGLYGIAVFVLASPFRRSPHAGVAAASAVCLLLLGQMWIAPWYQNFAHPPAMNVEAFAAIHPDLPIVAASGLSFVEMSKYESPAIVSRLYYLRDRAAALQFANATMFEDLDGFQAAFHFPGTVESYPDFVAAHRHFLVFGTIDYPEDWLLRKVRADGAKIRLIGSFATPYKDKNLYEVWLARNTR